MAMNRAHRKLCSSADWAGWMREFIPSVLAGVDLGDNVLEIGPGFGATTAVLAGLVPRLTAIEVDEASATALAGQFDGRVRIVHGSGAELPFADGEFSAVVCFTMLHHVPSRALQDALFTEARRVLRPGGVFAGSDSQLSLRFRLLHLGDTMVVVRAEALPGRLRAAGFTEVRVDHEPKKRIKWAAS
jgi:SAM-dependent methyltransferase